MYEPKWDGYRLCALVGAGGVSLWSRQGKDLTRYLPDLQEAIEAQVPRAACWMGGRDLDGRQPEF
ncbi:ATP-dependent DNA ligase [Pseudarthrobacter sulfonivorans]|uniref:ATP-dependent DNA ligase n=1 Tax=Pseudarthrobacter sulfonivorans TaxID=121292 RepID=UPI003593268F